VGEIIFVVKRFFCRLQAPQARCYFYEGVFRAGILQISGRSSI